MEGSKRAADFSSVTYDEALRRAEALIPFLREQAPKCEQLRRLTPEVMEALHRNGLFRYLQPRMWGGMELPFVSHYDIPEMLARGDISVGWVVTNLAGHHRSMTWWPQKAQEEVWRENPDAGIASGIAYQQGHAVPVSGGVQLSGVWNFSSGQDHSEWSQLACMVRDGDKVVDYAFCLLDRTQYEVTDDWHVLGMRATSSKTVRCKDVFVPAHRVVSMYFSKPGGHSFPGLEIHRNPAYRVPISALGGAGISGCLVGNARAALQTTIEWVKSRSTNYTGAKMRDSRPCSSGSRRLAPRSMRARSSCETIAWKPSASWPKAARSMSKRAFATSATSRWARNYAWKPSTRCTRWRARTASTTVIRFSACSAISVPRPATSASAWMRNCLRGDWSCSAENSKARRFR